MKNASDDDKGAQEYRMLMELQEMIDTAQTLQSQLMDELIPMRYRW